MITITPNYSMPIGTHWACSDRYNGLSQNEKMHTGFPLALAFNNRKRLKNKKISLPISKFQLIPVV